ncbi:MAG: histidine phosphatase family protein [Candidatus Heimdallarchaeota archaeon]|nr:histidine phosphatase family protein [Candidatus Heimdallarchaeota archaeon]
MKKIEHRRHSIRNQSNVHLNQAGVTLARKVGESMGNFDFIVSSGHERAYETAIAMGFAVDDIREELMTFGDEIMDEVENWTMTFSKIKEYYDQKGALYRYCLTQQKLYEKLLENIDEGESLLLITHGGVIDYPLVYLFPNADHQSWEDHFSYCEGYEMRFENGIFTNMKIKRVII